MYLSILLPSIFALYALYKKKLTLPGLLLAWGLGIFITYYGGYYAFAALATMFILTIASDKVKKNKNDKTRNVYQVISNILTAGLCIMLYAITGDYLFYMMYYAVVACSLGDTLASSIGVLSRKKPFNIFTFERIEKGASGGISMLGTFASLVGGMVIGLIYVIDDYNLITFAFISFFGVVGSFLDSIMGLTIQSQYRCVKCKKVVESRKHCKQKTKLFRGYSFVDNNLVNLLSNVIVLVLSYFIIR